MMPAFTEYFNSIREVKAREFKNVMTLAALAIALPGFDISRVDVEYASPSVCNLGPYNGSWKFSAQIKKPDKEPVMVYASYFEQEEGYNNSMYIASIGNTFCMFSDGLYMETESRFDTDLLDRLGPNPTKTIKTIMGVIKQRFEGTLNINEWFKKARFPTDTDIDIISRCDDDCAIDFDLSLFTRGCHTLRLRRKAKCSQDTSTIRRMLTEESTKIIVSSWSGSTTRSTNTPSCDSPSGKRSPDYFKVVGSKPRPSVEDFGDALELSIFLDDCSSMSTPTSRNRRHVVSLPTLDQFE